MIPFLPPFQMFFPKYWALQAIYDKRFDETGKSKKSKRKTKSLKKYS